MGFNSGFKGLISSSSCILPFIFPWITCFRRQLWPVLLSFLYCCRIFLSSLTLRSTSSFLTRSVQMIFSILLQHHISELSRYFWSNFRSVPVSATYKALLYKCHCTNFFVTCKFQFVGEKNLLAKSCFCHDSPVFNFTCTSCIVCYHVAQIV